MNNYVFVSLSNISKDQPLFGDGQKRSLVDRLSVKKVNYSVNFLI